MKASDRLQCFTLALSVLFLAGCGNGEEKHTYAMIVTDVGNMKVMLYNDTPLHRDNFVKLVSEGFYDDLLFHRVISGFMIQGGDPNSRDATPGQQLGSGGPGYQIPAEIGRPHIKGALAAARTGDAVNPEKKSSGSQFYIVQGTRQTPQVLDNYARQKNTNYSDDIRRIYTEIGGTPQLDLEYTVFGEIVEGMEVIDRIAAEQTDRGDRPVRDIKMRIHLVQ